VTLVRRFVGAALDAVFPPRCVSCGSFGAFICGRCLETASRAGGRRCLRCWLPVEGSGCRSCAENPTVLSAMRSVFTYRCAPRDAVLALKFHGLSALAPVMAQQMTGVLREWSPPVDVVVPVPLPWLRKRTRGYNQSGLLAAEIARSSGLRCEQRALRRKRHTAPQARQPDAAGRRANVGDAFAPGSRPVRGNVLLIDDVSTTGATLDACARFLLAGGAANVYALTFARED
jgi:ComF family protein